MRVVLRDGSVLIGERLGIAFHRTLRIPDDGRNYPLPPGLGTFPLVAANDCGDRVPPEWRGTNAFLVPMYQREALWVGFRNDGPPFAVTVAVGTVNAVSGRTMRPGLHADPQDYLVCPEQLWLDGVNVGPGTVRQFVAMRLGAGYTIEAAISGREEHGGLQISVFDVKPGATLAPEPPSASRPVRMMATHRMGLGAGGRIAQKIYPDPHGVDVWDDRHPAVVSVQLVNSLVFRALTGNDPPPTPIDARAYSERGLPWFALYEEQRGDVAAPDTLAAAKTIAERDRERGQPSGDEGFDVDPTQITKLGGPSCQKD